MKIYDASGFNSSLTGSFSGSFKGTVGSHLLPESNITLDLGSDTQRWRDLYLSGSTIYLGTSIITATPAGGITFKDKNTLTLQNLETTSSYALFAISASEAAHSKTADLATTAITASYSLNAGENQGFPFSGSADVTGSLFVSGGNISGSFVGDFTGDGSGLTNLQLSQATAVTDQFINATFKRVQHNFNSKNVIVAVFNENDEVIFPDSIKTVDANNVDVTFHSARTGRVVVNRGGHIVSGSINITENTAYEDVFDNVTTKTVVHNFNTKNVFVSTFNEAGYLMFPKNTRIINENIVQLDFISPTSGRVVVGKGGHLISGSLVTETTTVTDTFTSVPYTIVSHNFNTKDVIVSVYLDDDTLFFPDVIKTLDVNTVRVDFDQERSGRVVVAKGGHLISGSISVVEATLFEDTFTNEQEILPVHSFGTKNVNVVVYDNLDEQLIPSSVNTITDNQVRIRFEKPRSGRVVITKGGHLVSGSYAVDYKNILNKPNLVSGSLDYSGILNKPNLVSGSGDMADLGIYGLVGLEYEFYAQMAPNKATT
jgi:hypothetical protein